LTADTSIGGGNKIAYYSEYTSNSIRHSGVLRPEGTSRGMHKRVKTTYYGYAMKGIAEQAGPCSRKSPVLARSLMVQQCSPSLLLDLIQLGAQLRIHTAFGRATALRLSLKRRRSRSLSVK
jgi:hypothetical protein